jgi:hypothetical protein
LLGSLALSACAATPVAHAQSTDSTPPLRTVSVSGSGQAVLTPDIAYITIGVRTENANASEAVAANSTATDKVIQALKAQGIDPKDIRTTNFSIYPQQQYDNNGKLVSTTFVVENQVYVTIRDLDKIGQILDAAVKAGANTIYGITFDVQDKSAALAEARKEAVDNAHAAAEELAAAAGVKIVEVQSITSSSSSPSPLPMFARVATAAEAAPSVPISTGQLTFTVDVQMVYTIE